MENPQPAQKPEKKSKEFRLFVVKRIIIGTTCVLALLWGASYVLNLYESHEDSTAHHASTKGTDHTDKGARHDASSDDKHAGQAGGHQASPASHDAQTHSRESHGSSEKDPHDEKAHGQTDAHQSGHDQKAVKHDKHKADAAAHKSGDDKHASAEGQHGEAAEAHHAKAGHGDGEEDAHGGGHGHGITISDVKGVTFVLATIAPLRYELEERFYGWRPNDIIRPADNVKNYQLGVLEVTRRTVEALTERISRTGSAQAFDTDLELARNNLMINADDYMMPSAESNYAGAIEALERYMVKLENGTAPFYSRTVNLIPLLVAYESMLGSCDDNLTKTKEDDGRDVSWFRADDYFYYAQGVANAMQIILQAVAVDFSRVIESRRGDDVLHHAVEALHHATEIKPWIILDGDPDGFTANHRANLAAYISHARFYVGLLIQTLST